MEDIQFAQWKEQYWNLYYAEIEGEEFLFRELSRSEYKRGLRLYKEDAFLLEEYICAICTLEPSQYDFSECMAGIPTSLSDMILYESGFSEESDKIVGYMEKYRKEMSTFDNQISCVIKEAFPDLSMEEIEDWPMEKAIWYYTRAEYIIGTLRGIDLTIEAVEKNTGPREETNQKAVPEDGSSKDKKFNYQLDGEGSISDFPELSEIQAFMKGKWAPPPTIEGEELL